MMMIMIVIASGPNSAKPMTIQQRMYWVGKGRVANHGSVLSHGRRSRSGNTLRRKQKMLSPKGSNNNYVQKKRSKDKEVKKI